MSEVFWGYLSLLRLWFAYLEISINSGKKVGGSYLTFFNLPRPATATAAAATAATTATA